MRTPAAYLATALLIGFVFAPHARAEDDTVTAVLKSAGGKGAEVAAKQLAKILYDTSCTTGNNDPANKYICSILGSASGRAEEEWKADVTKKLDEISTQLKTVQKSQEEVKKALNTQHQVMMARFDQASANVVAVTNMVRIEGLWEKYEAQFDKLDEDVTRDSMLAFAKDIVKNDLHTKIADLNVVLTKDVMDGQPILRFPFYEWRLKQTTGVPVDKVDFSNVYDFSEKKFADFRLSQEKAYMMYLWAATVLESQCKLKPEQCTALPRSTKDFKADYERYTRQQAETFNAAVDWLVLSYGYTRVTTSGSFLPATAMSVLLRANLYTATLLSPDGGQGLWGRVISMGNKWDGKVNVTCGGTTQTLTPVFKYAAPVGGSGGYFGGADSGPLDWWVSRAGNGVYDEVRFSDKWQIYHYSFPAAAAGPCTVAQNVPQGGILPWINPGTKVVSAKTSDDQAFRFGSFVAIQRAGGNYALVSGGKWTGTREPQQTLEGKGQREKVVYEWFVEPDHPSGPWMGVLSKARAEYKAGNLSSRIHNRHVVSLMQEKKIYFPDDRKATLNFFPGQCSGALCNYGNSVSMLLYDVENNDTDSKKGKLDATVGVYFDPSDHPMTIARQDAGVVVDRSYGKTGDHKKANVDNAQFGVVKTDANTGYHLIYLMYFDLETEGRGWDASEYMYRGLLAPGSMYLTR